MPHPEKALRYLLSSLSATLIVVFLIATPSLLYGASEAPPRADIPASDPQLSKLVQDNAQLESEINALKHLQEAKLKKAVPEVPKKQEQAAAKSPHKGFFEKIFAPFKKTPEEAAAQKKREEEVRQQKALQKAARDQQAKEAAMKRAAREKEAQEKKGAAETARKEAAAKMEIERKEMAAKKAAELNIRQEAETKRKLEAKQAADQKRQLAEQARREKAAPTNGSSKKTPVGKEGVPQKKAETPSDKTEKFLFPSPPLLANSGNLKTELPRSGLLNLEDCLEHSIAVSLPKEIAAKRRSLNTLQLTKSIRDLFPEVTFNFTGTQGKLSPATSIPGDPGFQGRYKEKSYSFEGKQPLFRGFQLVNTMMKDKYNRRAAVEEIRKAVNESTYSTLVAYFQLTRSDLIWKNHKEEAEEAGLLLKQSAEKKSQGLISEIEFLNVQSLYADMMQAVETMWGDKEVAALDLKKALRLPPEEPVEIVPLYDYNSYNPESIQKFGEKVSAQETQLKLNEPASLDDYIAMAYKNRPDLKMEENKLIANRYAEKAAKGVFMPRSDLVIKGGKTAEGYIPNTPPPFRTDYSINIETSWNLGGNTVKHVYSDQQTSPSLTTFQGQDGTIQRTNTFTAQLLDGLQQYIDVRQAKVETLEQLQVYEDAERQAVQQVVESFYKYRAAVVKLNAAAAGLDYRKRSLELSKLKLEKNEIQISEYLEALKELTTQRDDFHTAMSDYFSSKADLNHAVGLENLVPIDEFIDLKNEVPAR